MRSVCVVRRWSLYCSRRRGRRRSAGDHEARTWSPHSANLPPVTFLNDKTSWSVYDIDSASSSPGTSA